MVVSLAIHLAWPDGSETMLEESEMCAESSQGMQRLADVSELPLKAAAIHCGSCWKKCNGNYAYTPANPELIVKYSVASWRWMPVHSLPDLQ